MCEDAQDDSGLFDRSDDLESPAEVGSVVGVENTALANDRNGSNVPADQ